MQRAPSPSVVEKAELEENENSDARSAEDRASSLEVLLEQVEPPPEAAAAPQPAPQTASSPATAAVGLRTARLLEVTGHRAKIAWRGRSEALDADVASDVEPALLAQARAERQTVLVEHAPGERPMVVGVLQTRIPSTVHLKGEVVQIEAEREVLLRSGRAGVRLRADGDVEIVGSRIHAASRGLFKLVGRILRLN